jgi:hypothetical protein
MISREQVNSLLLQFKRAQGYCDKAIHPSRKPTMEELMMEPTRFYSGASGFACSTLQMAIDTLELHL